MPEIEVRVYATLQKYVPKQDLKTGNKMSIDGNTTIKSLLDNLGIPVEETKIIIVNGVHAELDTVLKDGDRVAIFPPVAGG
ncbi:MAG: MoaD/ThiS family protein [Candidatus Schekmanbacteria bacterium]|nr:MAG: MoaD/ThiS family protein [Candidatus Schekmanbacteria bacterium]